MSRVSRVIGIPPHIQNAMLCSKLLKLCSETLAEVKSLTTNIKDAVSEAYEQKAEENGNLTGEKLKEIFGKYHGQVLRAIDERIKDISMVPQDNEVVQECNNNYAEGIIDNDNTRDTNIENIQHRLHSLQMRSFSQDGNYG